MATLRLLLTEPGALSEAWASGRRAPFVSPVRLYVMLGGALLLVTAAAGWVAVDTPDATPSADLERAGSRQAACLVGKAVGTLGLNALPLLVPLVGFATYVLFKERRRFLAGHLVWALHVASAALAVLVGWKAAGLVRLGFDTAAGPWARDGVLDAAFLTLFVGVAGYATLAARRFFQLGWGRAVTAGLLIALIPPAVLFVAIVAVAMALQLG